MSSWHRGVVTNVRDPDDRGRVRLRVPQLLGSAETGWIEPMFPSVSVMAGDRVLVSVERKNMVRLLFAATSDVVDTPALQLSSTSRGRSLLYGDAVVVHVAYASISGGSTVGAATTLVKSWNAEGTASGTSTVSGYLSSELTFGGETTGVSDASAAATRVSYGDWSNTLTVTTDA